MKCTQPEKYISLNKAHIHVKTKKKRPIYV